MYFFLHIHSALCWGKLCSLKKSKARTEQITIQTASLRCTPSFCCFRCRGILLPRVYFTLVVLLFHLFHEFKLTAPLWFFGSQGQRRLLKLFSNMKLNFPCAALTGFVTGDWDRCQEDCTYVWTTTHDLYVCTILTKVQFHDRHMSDCALARHESTRNKQAGESPSTETGSELHKTPQRMKRPRDLWGFIFVGLRTLGVMGGRRVADMNMVFYILVWWGCSFTICVVI